MINIISERLIILSMLNIGDIMKIQDSYGLVLKRKISILKESFFNDFCSIIIDISCCIDV